MLNERDWKMYRAKRSAQNSVNDARWLRETQGREQLLAEMVRQGAERFRGRAQG